MKMNSKIKNALLLVIGAILLMFSGLNWHIAVTAWIAPVFLLLYTRNSKFIHFLIFFAVISVVGAVSQTGNNLMKIPFVDIFNGISFGLLYTLLFILDKLMYKKNDQFIYTLIFPSLFALTEFLLAFAFGTWGSMVHTQYEFLSFLQISSIIGIYGVWFMMNWFASIVYWIIENKDHKQKVIRSTVIFIVVFGSIIIFGILRIQAESSSENSVKFASVLSDVDIHDIADNEAELFLEFSNNEDMEVPDRLFSDSSSIQTMINRTNDALEQGAKIIVWNEISLILNQKQKTELIETVQFISKRNNVYLLTAFLEESADLSPKPFNNISVFISPNGEILWEYKKSFLQPTAEALIVNPGNYEIPVVTTPYGEIGTVICADLDMQHYIKQAGERSVDILLVPAYDWEGITPLHSQMARIHAVQFGVSIVRANGKGISVVYDQKGKEISSMNTLQSDKKILMTDLQTGSVDTVYSNLGNIFILLCSAFLLFAVIRRIFRRN